MRSMTRNRRAFYYASVLTVGLGQDADGNYTENTFTYSDPVKREGVITPASGEAQTQLFGMNEIYDKVITLNQGENFLEVGSVLWIDKEVALDAEGHLAKDEAGNVITPYNYIVVKVANSLNFVSVAIRKVDVS